MIVHFVVCALFGSIWRMELAWNVKADARMTPCPSACAVTKPSPSTDALPLRDSHVIAPGARKTLLLSLDNARRTVESFRPL